MKTGVALLLALLALGCRSDARPEAKEPVPASENPSTPQSAPGPDRSSPPRGQVEARRKAEADRIAFDGLRWLARHQNPDGSWGALSMRSRCVGDKPCSDPGLRATDHYDEGLTGLALLCFLDGGFGPESKAEIVDGARGERYEIGEVVGKGLEWLRARQQPDGSFTKDRAFMYNEALATMAMVEAYGLTKDPRWKEPAQRAVDFLQAAQRPNPSGSGAWGWRYASRAEVEKHSMAKRDEGYLKELFDSDTSTTGLCVLALGRAYRRDLEVKPGSMSGALEFSKFATANDGLVGYLDAKGAGATVTGPFDDQFVYHPTVMSAHGMLIRLIVAADFEDPFHALAAKRILADLPRASENRSSIDYYYWHSATNALHELDGPSRPERSGRFWRPWEKAILEVVPALQDRTENACSHGGWLASDRWGSYSGAGPLYDTAMSVLTLTVPYRY